MAIVGLALLMFALSLDQPVSLPPAALPAPLVRAITLPPTVQPVRPAEPQLVTLAAAPYLHASGAFAILYPDGWQIDESEDAVLFTSPDESAQISVSFAPIESRDLGDVSRSHLLAAWGDLPDFALDELLPPTSSTRLTYALRFRQTVLPENQPVEFRGRAVYQADGGTLFSHTYLARAELFDQFADAFRLVAQSLQTNPPLGTPDSE